MAMSEKRAKDLADIEPPRSVLRISNFLRDLTRGGMPSLDTFAIGGGGTMAMQTGLAQRAAFFPSGGFLEAFARLTAHYAVKAEDLEAFAHWLVDWIEKYKESDVIEDPRIYDEPVEEAPKARALPVVAPPISEEPLRRTRRGEDPPREKVERPQVVQEEVSTETAKPKPEGKATFRPAKREPLPETSEPPKRIDLAALIGRTKMVGVGSGAMLAGVAMAAPSNGGMPLSAAMSAPTAGGVPLSPGMTQPVAVGHESFVRTVYIDRATGAQLPPQAPGAAPSASAPQFFQKTVPHREAPTFQADEPMRAKTPTLSEGSSYIESPTGEVAQLDAQISEVPGVANGPFARTANRPGFPSVKTILTGAAILTPALASAFSFPGKHREEKADGSVRPSYGEPEYGGQIQGDGSVRPQFGDPVQGDGSVRPQYGSPAMGDGSVRSIRRPMRRMAALGTAALAAGAMASTTGGQWVPATEDGPQAVFGWPHMHQPGRRGGEGIRIVGTGEETGPMRPGAGRIPSDPRYGQITLIAPPLSVASPEGERAGSAVQFEWAQLAENSGELDAAGLGRLAAMLPRGAQAIYPALPPGTAGAANLRLSPGLLGTLLERGYGPGAAAQAGQIAAATPGVAKVARPMPGSLVPVGRPAGASADGGVLGAAPGAGAIADAGGAQAKRGGALDFLGVPVRLAPTLGGKAELRQQQAVQTAGADMAAGRPIRPEAFAPLRQKLFPNMGAVSVEPDKAAWRKAAPSFGMRGGDPTTVLASDATAKPENASGPAAPSAAKKVGVANEIASRLGITPSSARTGLPATSSALGAPASVPASPKFGLPTSPAGGHRGHFPSHAPFGLPHQSPSPTHAALDGVARPASASFPGTQPFRSQGLGQISGGPSSGRPAPGPTGAGRTSTTAAPSAVEGGHVPFVDRPADPPSSPSVRSFSPKTGGIGSRSIARPGGLGEALSSSASSIGAPSPSSASSSASSSSGSLASRPSVGPLASSPRATPTPITVSRPSLPRRHSPTPEMLYSAAPPRSASRPLAIQRSIGGMGDILQPVVSQLGSLGKPKGSENSGGNEANEVNSLATEVWSLLKRRLANEAERRGRF